MHLAAESGDPGQRLEAHTALANTYFFKGDFVEVENQARAAMAIYDRRRFRNHAHIYGTDPGVSSLSRLANAGWQRGRADRGRVHLVEMLNLAEDLGHQFTLCSALNLAALIRLFRCEPAYAHEHAERAFTISEAHDYRFAYAWSSVLRGQALFDLGRYEDGMREMERGFECTRGLSARLMEAWFIMILASAKLRYGRPRDAANLLHDAFSSIESAGTAFALPAFHCLNGELLLGDGAGTARAEEAYAAFLAGATIARAHGSRALELRALTGIVNARRGTPHETDALRSLQHALRYFTPGPDSQDIEPALALIAERAQEPLA
jgi:tetratricopeptide (TPR) repeat protein